MQVIIGEPPQQGQQHRLSIHFRQAKNVWPLIREKLIDDLGQDIQLFVEFYLIVGSALDNPRFEQILDVPERYS